MILERQPPSEQNDSRQQPESAFSATRKKPYSTPQLTVHGSVEEITQTFALLLCGRSGGSSRCPSG
jgi:hypothetical protein